ncbi:hypothetical protein EV368DRAFT_72728 [Lentinula lateritia]|nr:hypothetical protein EV368DRAFT_72728 [Lentinula lateritia]
MAHRFSERSNLIDVTFTQLHSVLSGQVEGTNYKQIGHYLTLRISQLKAIVHSFGRPTTASREKINSGTVTLHDGVVLHVEDADKDFVFAISDAFRIDEIFSLILLHSFLYNEGLPIDVADNSSSNQEFIEAFLERLSLLRVLVPLFRAKENVSEPLHEIVLLILPTILPDGQKFAHSLLVEYERKARESLPENVGRDPKKASRWAKQNTKEQLVILEVLFWTLWDSVAFLELETVADSSSIEISDNPQRRDFYIASPDSMKRIHELLYAGGTCQFACTYDRKAVHVLMSRICSEPKSGLLSLMEALLTNSPLFVTSVAWKTGSTVTDPNAITFRSVFKGLVISLVELVPVEIIPEFDLFVEVWIALSGRSEAQSVAGICSQYWQVDWKAGLARRAIFDVCRTRFPIQCRPLIRLLRCMTAAGFLDTDSLSTADHSSDGDEPGSAVGMAYANVRPIILPGGSILPVGSKGRLLNGDGGDLLVVIWHHEHSGWKLLLEVLMAYAFKLRSGSDRYATDEMLITDILDLVRSVIHNNPARGEQLMQSLEAELSPMSTSSTPDLVQLTVSILEEALAHYNAHPMAISSISTHHLYHKHIICYPAIPNYAIRVWIYIRSTTTLFGSEKNPGFSSAALSTERVTGRYTMTLAILKLIEQLCEDASLLLVPDDLQVRKFVYTEKYAQLSNHYEIGRRISSFYLKVLQYTPLIAEDAPFPKLSQATLDLPLFKASVLATNPLMSAVSAGTQMLQALYLSRRFGDARRLIYLLESHLRLIRLVLQRKCSSEVAHQTCLLEQALCTQITGGVASHDPYRSKVNPIDALTFYVKERDAGPIILSIICSSLSMSRSNSSTLVGHLSDPESVVASFVHVVQHPLFVSGQFRSLGVPAERDVKGKGKGIGPLEMTSVLPKIPNAIDVARDALANWEQLWESNPQLLALVWRHGLEHKPLLEDLRLDPKVWDHITMLACSELGPIPDFETEDYVFVDGKRRSNVHDAVAEHCYRTDVQSCALHVIGLDIGIYHQTRRSANAKPELTDLISEATLSSYVPAPYDAFSETLKCLFPTLSISQLETKIAIEEREFGDEFSFSVSLLRTLVDAWRFILHQITPLLADVVQRSILLTIAASENRLGDMVAIVHGARIAFLVLILELASEVQLFIELLENVRGIVLNDMPFHRPLLQLLYFRVKHARSAEQRLKVLSILGAAVGFVIDALRLTFMVARTKDMELLIAVFEQFWLTHIKLYVHIDLVGVTLYTPHLLTFHLALARIPSAAERLAGEGLLSAKAASTGLIDEVLPELPGHCSPAHHVYCCILSIVSAIIACGLIARALSWTMDQVVNVLSALARNAPPTLNAKPIIEDVLHVFCPLALRLLQQVNHVFEEERTLLEKDAFVSDVWKRPLIVHLLHRLFQLWSKIIFTLTCISKADTVLIAEESDWPLHEALVVPHSKIVVGESASIGTLLELANGTLDMLRNLTNMPSGQSLVQADVALEKLKELNVQRGVNIARRNLGEILLYMITQLAMWLSKPEFEAPPADLDGEDQTMADSQKPETKERRVTFAIKATTTETWRPDVEKALQYAIPSVQAHDTIERAWLLYKWHIRKRREVETERKFE